MVKKVRVIPEEGEGVLCLLTKFNLPGSKIVQGFLPKDQPPLMPGLLLYPKARFAQKKAQSPDNGNEHRHQYESCFPS